MEATRTYDPSEAVKAQRKYCEETGDPHFAPRDGICYRCRINIYREDTGRTDRKGISLESASTQLVTGCPFCCYSYCE